MALITCPECKKKISEHASICPNCGYKLTPEMIAKIKKNEKNVGMGCAIIIILGFLFIFIPICSNESKNSSSVQENLPTPTVATIGESLTVGYFQIKVNSVKVQKTVNTGNMFSNLKADAGNVYFIMNVTFRNIDKESRMVVDGDLIFLVDGKEYVFDQSESVLADGYGLFLDQLNPLVSKTTNLVYKIPEGLKGKAYYRPGRNSGDMRIFLKSF